MTTQQFDYIVIGAGIAGALCASRIQASGKRVMLLEKARGSGGRLSSKRILHDRLPPSYDLGAQMFECSSPKFNDFLNNTDGVQWLHGEAHKKAVAEGRNSSLTRALIEKVDARFSTRVLNIERIGAGWKLICESHGTDLVFESRNVVLATPPVQAAEMLGEHHEWFEVLSRVEHEAQWLLMFAVPENGRAQIDIESPDSEIVHSIYADNLKRSSQCERDNTVWIVHAKDGWTRDNLDLSNELVAEVLLNEFNQCRAANISLQNDVLAHHVHRWLYARPKQSARLEGTHINTGEGIFLCGDYFNSGSKFGVESAFLSASALYNDLFN